MLENRALSKAKISELSKLHQKKHRQQRQVLVLEGQRLLHQLADYGVHPLELYYAEGSQCSIPPGIPVYQIREAELKKICDSEHPAGIAGLYPLPHERRRDFHSALYLDGIADPGNLGTIFRLAAAFGIAQLFLSPQCCDIGNPKLVRASLGAVYHVAFQTVTHKDLLAMQQDMRFLDMDGTQKLGDIQITTSPCIYVLGSEAHGVSPELKRHIDKSVSIEMVPGMESLNVAVAAGILCYQIYKSSGV